MKLLNYKINFFYNVKEDVNKYKNKNKNRNKFNFIFIFISYSLYNWIKILYLIIILL